MQIKHIFFDLDHTLWDFESNSDKAFETIFIKHQINLELNEFLEIYRPINLQYWKLFREDKVSKADLRYGRLKEAFDAITYSISDDLINQLAIDYIDVLPNHNQLFDGTHEILEHLKPNYKLHIITNGFDEVQHKKIEKSGLSTYFDKVITSEKVGVKKPNPEIFLYALREANANANESIMIGDNLEADILGAMANGFDAIHCNFNGYSTVDSIKTVTHLLELKKYL